MSSVCRSVSLIAPLVSGVAGLVRRPAARRTHWTFDVQTDVIVTLDNN